MFRDLRCQVRLEPRAAAYARPRRYRGETGVASDSTIETFAALRLYVDSWRWQGVPFYIRAGKSLPATATELVVRLRRPPRVFPTCSPPSNYFRFRISPDISAAFGLTVNDLEEKMIGQPIELVASRPPSVDEEDAYERVLGDAMEGDPTLFAREDYVEEAWRIVDPLLKAGSPVYEYEPGTWGPGEVDRVTPADGWCNPIVEPGGHSRSI
jgi:glucose-6-phosphate 1-dehydrogenase